MHVKFCKKNEHLLPPWDKKCSYISYRWGQEMFVFQKIWCALISCYLSFEFPLLPCYRQVSI